MNDTIVMIDESSTFLETLVKNNKSLAIGLTINAVLGLVIFEYAYWQSRRLRNVDEDRDSKFPAMRRTDVRKWRRWKFWPFAMTLLPLRIFGLIFFVFSIIMKSKLLTCGHDFNKEPLKAGFRKMLLYKWIRVSGYMIVTNCGLFINRKKL